MIYNNGTFLSGEKPLYQTFILFFLAIPAIYNLFFLILGYLLIQSNPFVFCPSTCLSPKDMSMEFNITYYLGNLFVIFTTFFMMMSCYILWKNSKNTYNEYSVYSARIFSIGIGFASFIFFLWGIWAILIPESHLHRIIPDLFFNDNGQLSSIWKMFVTTK